MRVGARAAGGPGRHRAPRGEPSHGKRVLYLDLTHLDETYIGPAVDGPDLADPLLRRRVGQLHAALAHPAHRAHRDRRGRGHPVGRQLDLAFGLLNGASFTPWAV
ncbi:hypothetical protein GCM10010341_70160 [Streptomyces noursei]|nr:hypothetical protein GCM10010341_70160 [Streptomyces noursei]